jgi:hypothetical protein
MARRRESDSVIDRPLGSVEEPDGASQLTAAQRPQPTTEEIAQRAYEIYQSRGGTDGQDIEDWLEAERQLKRGLQTE